ncbi:MAG: nuclear transport factor 2 family protein [Actinomycetota bacterium]
MTPEDLVEIEAIKQLKHAYARLLDTKRWDVLAALFVPDATASYSGGQLSFTGRDAIIAFLRRVLASPKVLTVHNMGQPEIELLSSDRARATWALRDEVIMVESGTYVRGASLYEDEYRKVDGSWRFAHTGYRRLFEEIGPRPADVSLTASWFEDEGRSSIAAPTRSAGDQHTPRA